MLQAIIFDCWGTLFTTSLTPHPFEVFARRVGHSIKDYSYVKRFEHHLMEQVYTNLQLPIRELLDTLQVTYDQDLLEELETLLLGSIPPQAAYPDTMQVLDQLRPDFKLILLTNTFKQGFEGLDAKFNLSRRFDSIITSYDMHVLKPDPRMFQAAIAAANCPASKILMVGDNLKDDIAPAHALGLKTCLLDRKNSHPHSAKKISGLLQLQQLI